MGAYMGVHTNEKEENNKTGSNALFAIKTKWTWLFKKPQPLIDVHRCCSEAQSCSLLRAKEFVSTMSLSQFFINKKKTTKKLLVLRKVVTWNDVLNSLRCQKHQQQRIREFEGEVNRYTSVNTSFMFSIITRALASHAMSLFLRFVHIHLFRSTRFHLRVKYRYCVTCTFVLRQSAKRTMEHA